MNFVSLARVIHQTHTTFQQETNKAINKFLTIRNWLIGFYIVEFEQMGEDRAKYGASLMDELADKIKIRGLSPRNLRLFRSFYLLYPQIADIVTEQLKSQGNNTISIWQSVTAKLQISESQSVNHKLQVPANKIISKLSFTHLAALIEIKDPLKRTWYEIQCIKGNWSIRELRRQINSLYFERSGLSKQPEKLSALVSEKAETPQPTDFIKSVYTFEFLGLQTKDVVEENDLEKALLDNLQQFMLELGDGFCFEARQKRILIGDEYYFIDLVFYHRILKCHILLDLKIDKLTSTNAGQLNTYLNYYKAEVSRPDDNPPVGILLVANKDKTLVEYATAGMDRQLFVSKYLVELPSKKQLEDVVQYELNHF